MQPDPSKLGSRSDALSERRSMGLNPGTAELTGVAASVNV